MLRDRLVVPMLLMSIAACGGGGGSSAPAISEIVGGMVTGLAALRQVLAESEIAR
jgi:hypothetical protein